METGRRYDISFFDDESVVAFLYVFTLIIVALWLEESLHVPFWSALLLGLPVSLLAFCVIAMLLQIALHLFILALVWIVYLGHDLLFRRVSRPIRLLLGGLFLLLAGRLC